MSEKKLMGFDDAWDLLFEDNKVISDSEYCFVSAAVQRSSDREYLPDTVIFVYPGNTTKFKGILPVKVMLPRDFAEKYNGQVFHEVHDGMTPKEAEEALRQGKAVKNSQGTVFFAKKITLPNKDEYDLVFFVNPEDSEVAIPEIECELSEFHCDGEYEEYYLYEEEKMDA